MYFIHHDLAGFIIVTGFHSNFRPAYWQIAHRLKKKKKGHLNIHEHAGLPLDENIFNTHTEGRACRQGEASLQP